MFHTNQQKDRSNFHQNCQYKFSSFFFSIFSMIWTRSMYLPRYIISKLHFVKLLALALTYLVLDLSNLVTNFAKPSLD